VSSLNELGSTDLAPISSFWALGWTRASRIVHRDENRGQPCAHRECVVNLPCPEIWQKVEKTAPANRIPFREAQVCGGRAHSSCERSGTAGAGHGMPPGSYGGARYRTSPAQRRKAKCSAEGWLPKWMWLAYTLLTISYCRASTSTGRTGRR
jgi:hypothetical protein